MIVAAAITLLFTASFFIALWRAKADYAVLIAKNFPKTDQSPMNQFRAVDASAIGSKGLETDGNKPLMRNRERQIERLRDRDTARNHLT